MSKYFKALALAALMVQGAEARGLSGFYVGGAAGASLSRIQFSYDDGPANAIFQKGNGHLNKFNGALFLGFGHLWSNCLYAGGEFEIDSNFSRSGMISNNQLAKVTVKRKGAGYTLLARAGYAMIPTKAMVFVGLGVKSTEWAFQARDTLAPFASHGKSKRSWKFHVATGVEGLINDRLGWRVTYSYTPGKKIKVGEFPANHQLSGEGSFAKIKPNEHIVRVGLSFRV
jgi:hypothetical protein